MHAVVPRGGVRKKVVTSTFVYDLNGNVTQKTTDGVTTTYVWDYANRLTALGVGGATTTYGYDFAGQRVIQTGATTTTIYPFKWYSVASSTGSGARYSTTTEYVFNGDTLVSTVDQQFASGVATGTAKSRYIHQDHLGSTNIVSDDTGTVTQTLDYYPYGARRVNSGENATSRQFIGQFADQSGLSYLQARYMEPSRGQFLSQDPAVLGVDLSLLEDPQQLNMYSYARGNPLALRDRDGNKVELVTRPVELLGQTLGAHAFIMITNTPSAAANLQGLPNYLRDTTRITLGGYNNVATDELYKAINHNNDFNLSPSAYFESTQIVPPAQYKGNQTAFENAIIAAYNGLPNILGPYSVLGVPGFGGVGNSNNVATTILQRAGVDTSISRGYRPLNLNPARTPGLGTPLGPAPSSNSTGGSGGSSSGSSAYWAGQLGIGNTQGAFIGTYNFGPGVGTFNFGTGQWVK